MAAHVRLKNEFTEDEKYHNLMRWLIFSVSAFLSMHIYSHSIGPEKRPCGRAVSTSDFGSQGLGSNPAVGEILSKPRESFTAQNPSIIHL